MPDGQFSGKRGYIGVRFKTAACVGADFAYGWIDYEHTARGIGIIHDWAYEDNCAAIVAPARISSATPTASAPTMGQWGAGAMAGLMGLLGLNALRRRKEDK